MMDKRSVHIKTLVFFKADLLLLLCFLRLTNPNPKYIIIKKFLID